MPEDKKIAPVISLYDFVNNHHYMTKGKVEILGAFIHWMENEKHILNATEDRFKEYFEELKNLNV
jgi:hypothetical protein